MFRIFLVTPIFSILLSSISSESDLPKCGLNEVYAWCKRTHEASCRSPEPSGNYACKGYCICSKNYVRDDAGKCILMKNCLGVCGENAELDFVVLSQQRCLGPLVRDTFTLNKPGCKCKPGYYWFEGIKGCITMKECVDKYNELSRSRYG